MGRVLVIGLDGATFDLILPWVNQGKLPNFAQVLSEGSHGGLMSTVPAMTFPAWSSFMTGKNPGKHGIFDFTEREPGSYGIRFINRNWLKSKTIWSILSEAGKRVAVIGVPVTYPPERVNGLMISGFDAPGMEGGKADPLSMYPPSLHDELVEAVGGYVISANALAFAGDPDRVLRATLATMDQKIKCAKYLYTREPWDLFMIVLGETDSIAHHFWKYHDPRSPLHSRPPSPACSEAILTVYQRADAFIGEMLRGAWDSTTLILVSDHGIGGCGDMAVYLNRWLEHEGFLRFRAGSQKGWFNWARVVTSRFGRACVERAKQAGVKLIPAEWKPWLSRNTPALVGRMESYLRFSAIDWDKTAAFADENPYYPQIWLNVKGREPRGTIDPGQEYEAVRDLIIERLHQWKEPETGQRVIRQVFKREEVYGGPYVDKASDLLIDWNLGGAYSYVFRGSQPDKTMDAVRRLSPSEKASVKSGSHRELGILAVCGDGIRPNSDIKSAQIIDVAPTVLYLLGVPIPADMDGTVMENVIREDFLRTHQVRHRQAEGANVGGTEEGYSGAEAALIEERLRGLGYIE